MINRQNQTHLRQLLRSTVLAFMLAAMVLYSAAATPRSLMLASRPTGNSNNPLSSQDLPATARLSISATIGQDLDTYHITTKENLLHAENPAQALSADLSADEVRVTRGNNSWSLRLAGVGRGASLQPMAAVQPTAKGNRVTYERQGLSEWYVNGPFGLEQGFTLTQPPAGGGSAPLSLALALKGGIKASVEADRRGATLTTPDGKSALHYAGLSVVDARSKDLPAWIEAHGTQLWLCVEDKTAAYPLRIDPFIEAARLTASDKAGSMFLGYSISMSGDTVIAGAPYSNPGGLSQAGAVYVFVKPEGGWSGDLVESAKLTASDKAIYTNFGFAVAISGNTLVVGSIYATKTYGAAYVFNQPAGGWSGNLTESAKLTASDITAFNQFGTAVAISGNTIVVGAPNNNAGGTTESGAAYVFVRPSAGWSGSLTETVKLSASDKAPYNQFGKSVAINGDTIVVGSWGAHPGAIDSAGEAYVFVKPSGGWSVTASESARLTASDPAIGALFGYPVPISGDTIVAGASGAASGGVSYAGAAYVFVKPTGGWSGNLTESAKLTASDKAAYDRFGSWVAISDNTLVVGAPHASVGSATSPGVAYVFVKPSGGWTGTLAESTKLTASDRGPSNQFGYSGEINGSTVAVGAPYASPGGTAYAGEAYVFQLAPSASLSLTSWDFGSQMVNTTSPVKAVSLTNTGDYALTISSIIISGDFWQFNNCPAYLTPQKSCTISLTFTPYSTGLRHGTLTITDNSPSGSAQTVSLTGTGTLPGVELSPVVVNFGNQLVGQSSAAKAVTLTNPGDGALTIASITTYPLDFSQTNNCGSSLAAKANCTINVTFNPSTATVWFGLLSISDNAVGGLHTVSLEGTGTTSPVLAQTSLAFGVQPIGTDSPVQSTMLTNQGGAMVGITGITTHGDFKQTNTCVGFTLAVGSSCAVNVAFSPTAGGVRHGSISISFGTGVDSVSLDLSGTGVIRINLPTIFNGFGK